MRPRGLSRRQQKGCRVCSMLRLIKVARTFYRHGSKPNTKPHISSTPSSLRNCAYYFVYKRYSLYSLSRSPSDRRYKSCPLCLCPDFSPSSISISFLTPCTSSMFCPYQISRYADMGSRGIPIYLEFDGRSSKIHSRTIHQNLPHLWHNQIRMLQHRTIPLFEIMSPRNQHEMKALKLIVRYLTEVDGRLPVSAAIVNGLEALFDGSFKHLGTGFSSALNTFLHLGYLLAPENFGCGVRIFKQMEGFFVKHSKEILATHLGLPCMAALDHMSINCRDGQWDMIPALSCLVREWEIMGHLRLGRPDLPPLSRKSTSILKALCSQSRDRQRCHCRNILQDDHLHHGRPPLGRRSHSHSACFSPKSRGPTPGDAMRQEDLLKICAMWPELIDVHLEDTDLAVPCDYDDGLSDYDSYILGSDEEMLLDHSPGYLGYQQPDPEFDRFLAQSHKGAYRPRRHRRAIPPPHSVPVTR